MAGLLGFEPRLAESKSDVLPLHYRPTKTLGEPEPLAFPCLSRLRCSTGSTLASREGFEPSLAVLETVVLPLTPPRYKLAP